MNGYRIEFTFLQTCTAADTFLRVDDVCLLDLALDGSGRTCPGAGRTALAPVRIYGVDPEGAALVGRTALVHDVGHVLVVEVVDGREHGVGRCLAETAESGILDDLAEVLEIVQILHRTLALGDLVENLLQALVADTAGGALSAGLVHGELEVELGHGHHAVVLVHDDHTSERP